MALMNRKNYNEVVETSNVEVRNQDIVELTIIKIGLIKSLVDELEKYNEEQRSVGAPEVTPNFKTCGLSVTVAVTANGKNKIKYDRPKFDLKKELNFYPPRTCYDKNYNFQNKGGSNKVSMFDKTKPIVTDIYPSAFEAKDFKSGLTAKDIRELGKVDEYAEIINKEELRQTEWKELIEDYKRADAGEATTFLLDGFSRKWFLCMVEGDKVTYCIPSVGMRFYAKWIVRDYKGKPMTDIYPIEWNSVTKSFDIYSFCNVANPTEDDTLKAQAIRKVFDDHVPKTKKKDEEDAIDAPESNF